MPRWCGSVVLALATLLVRNPAVAQSGTTWLAGAGLSVPAGVFAAYADNGFGLTAAWEHRLRHGPFAIRVDLGYTRNSDTTGIGFHETTQIGTAMANLVYHFRGSHPRLYALAGLGYFGRRFSSDDPDDPTISDSQTGYQVGEGVIFRLHSTTVYFEGRFVSAFIQQPLRVFVIEAGIRLGGERQ